MPIDSPEADLPTEAMHEKGVLLELSDRKSEVF